MLKEIYSFDMVKKKDFIIKADIKKLPLEDQCADAAVFCLSLMGVNYIEFILEATRILRTGGSLFIAEVLSRVKLGIFINMIKSLGYTLLKRVT